MTKKQIIPPLSALVFLALGILYRPVRALTFCAAALILALTVLSALKHRSRCRAAYILLFSLLCGALGAFAFLEFQILSHDSTDPDTPVNAVVILGAGVNGTEPSLSLRVRLSAALDFLADKPDIPIVVTGGQGGGESITEARCMADWLIRSGLDAERIYLEERASNTRENVAYSQQLLSDLGVELTDNVAVVTADYHLYRTSLYWGTPWMVPVAAKMPADFLLLTLNYYIREAFAVAKLLVFGG